MYYFIISHWKLDIYYESESFDDFLECAIAFEDKQLELIGFNYYDERPFFLNTGERFDKMSQKLLYEKTKDDLRWNKLLEMEYKCEMDVYKDILKLLKPLRGKYDYFQDFVNTLT